MCICRHTHICYSFLYLVLWKYLTQPSLLSVPVAVWAFPYKCQAICNYILFYDLSVPIQSTWQCSSNTCGNFAQYGSVFSWDSNLWWINQIQFKTSAMSPLPIYLQVEWQKESCFLAWFVSFKSTLIPIHRLMFFKKQLVIFMTRPFIILGRIERRIYITITKKIFECNHLPQKCIQNM